MLSSPRLNVLGVPFDAVSLESAVGRLEQACEGHEQLFCVTPNPEICLIAHHDRRYLETLRSAQLSFADGFGILWVGRYLAGKRTFLRWIWTLLTPWWTKHSSPFPERVTGTDVMQSFCDRYRSRKIFLLGASPDVNERLFRGLKHDGVNVVGHFSGDESVSMETQICSMINTSGAEVLFVAFGAPKQEFWIARNFSALTTVRVAIGVGGAFDFLVGKKRRAPRWMRSLGLEWIFRLLIEPRRIGRILRATIVFPWTVLLRGKKM